MKECQKILNQKSQIQVKTASDEDDNNDIIDDANNIPAPLALHFLSDVDSDCDIDIDNDWDQWDGDNGNDNDGDGDSDEDADD